MINGRRMAPAGVEGAPTNPSLNLIPGSLIERYDLLLDGASSVYGSDAVAVLVTSFCGKISDGLELFARGDINPQGAGEDYTISGSYGINSDRGFIGIGFEYDKRDRITLADRDFFDGCNTHYEIDGMEIFGRLVCDVPIQDRTPGVSVSESECRSPVYLDVFSTATRDSVQHFPANGNIANIPRLGYGDSSNAFGTNLDTNGDGIRDVDFKTLILTARCKIRRS